MRRRAFIALFGGAAVAGLLAAQAQQSTRMRRIGWLVTGSPTSHGISLAAFQEGLRNLGYIEGKNVRIEYRWAEGEVDRLPALATELVQLDVDLILAGGSFGAKAAKNATQRIPIVMAGVGESVATGLVRSLARPGGNMTGFTFAEPESAGKRLELLKEMVPALKNLAVIWASTNPYSVLQWKVVQKAATRLELSLNSQEAGTLEEIEHVLSILSRTSADAVMVLDDPLLFTYRKKIVDSIFRAKLPSSYGLSEYVADGGLMSYGADISDTYRRAATYVDKILRGEKPADLPVQLPTKFETVINLKTAKALGLAVPQTLLSRADEVIE